MLIGEIGKYYKGKQTVKVTHNPLPAREQQVLLLIFLAGLF